MFTEVEIAFLLKPHKLETADRNGRRIISAAQDLRTLGCPHAIFTRVLEDRARKLGQKFVEFRNAQRFDQTTAVPDLETKIAASRLF